MTAVIVPTPSVVWYLSTYALCIGALILQCQRQLALWVCVSSLNPNVAPDAPAPKSIVPTRSESEMNGNTNWPTLRAVYRRFSRSKAPSIIVIVLFWGMATFLFGWVLPKFGTRLILDCFWGIVQCGLLFSVYNTAITTLVPTPRGIRYRLATPTSPLTFKREDLPNPHPSLLQLPRVRTATAAVMSIATLASALAGYDGLLMLVPAMWVVNWTLMFGTMSLRRTAQICIAVIAIFAAIVPTTKLVEWLWSIYVPTTSTQPKDDDAEKRATPSAWLVQVMLLISIAQHIVPSMTLVTLTYRYEYSKAHSVGVVAAEHDSPTGVFRPSSLSTRGDNEKTAAAQKADAAILPTSALAPANNVNVNVSTNANAVPPISSLAPFSHPLTNCAFTALFIACVGLAVLPSLVPQTAAVLTDSPIGLIGPTTAVLGALASAAWWNGEVSRWWAYSETWIPKREDAITDDERDVDDVEKASES